MQPLRCAVIVAGMLLALATAAPAQDLPGGRAQEGRATFRSSVDLVRVSAAVRDRKGRLVGDLTARDFEVLEGSELRPIAECRDEPSGVSIALLFDVSGSMASRMGDAREAAEHILSWLVAEGDDAGVFTFDTRLDEVAPFAAGLQHLPSRLESVDRKSTRLNSSHVSESRMPSSA